MPVAATVVGDPPMPAVGAGFDMAAERGGAAMLDRRHDLELMQAQMPGMGHTIGRPRGAEKVGDTTLGAHRPQPPGASSPVNDATSRPNGATAEPKIFGG